MSVNNLAISYRCHSAIGNSLELSEMMEEVISTFIEETNAIFGTFYLLEDTVCHIVSHGKQINFNLNELISENNDNKIVVKDFNEKLNLVIYKLDSGAIYFIYDKSVDLEYIVSIYESFRKKLNISICSCINVKKLQDKNKKLKNLSLNLQKEVDLAIEINKEKEKQIFEHLKMAQMGELIGNIAHQWRQPLSVISTASSGMKLKKEMNILSDQDFFHYTDSIYNNVEHLSRTIDEFRDYIKDTHRQKEVIIQDRVIKALQMVVSSYELDNIEIIEEYMDPEAIYFKIILGELLQVLISILNNAKEALVSRDIKNRWIKYSVHKKEYSVLISIEDNAGGIDDDIKDKIFIPYFTTKHQSQGTGIGLYSSYDIIVNHLNGKFYVENTEHGAKFFIELPLNHTYVI